MRWNPQLIWTDILAVHAALLHSGEIIFFTGNEFWGVQHDKKLYDHVRLFNCQTLGINKVEVPDNISDLFCCGHAFFGSGNLLMAGGTIGLTTSPHIGHSHFYGERRTSMFDAKTKRLIECAELNKQVDSSGAMMEMTGGRWYPTLVTLGSGKILAIGGHPDRADSRHSANTPEYFEWNRWRYVKGGIDPNINFTDPNNPLEYPRLHLLPDGKIFSSTPFAFDRVMRYELNVGWSAYPTSTPSTVDWTETPLWKGLNNADGHYQIYNQFNGTSVLLPLTPENNYEARVMVHGNTDSYIIDLSTPDPGWQKVTGRPISKRRLTVNSVLLPTGEVFFCGGVEGEIEEANDGSNWTSYRNDTRVNEAEIYNPFTGQWTLTPEAEVIRNYHSVALLMPDGRVWTAGSSKNHEANSAHNIELRIEIFEPSYYGLPTRPLIRNVISEHGDVSSGLRGEFIVVTDGNNEIKRVAVIRNGSVTHGFNSDQRYVGLPFTVHNQGVFKELRVSIPDNPNLMVPGHYMLFLIDGNGVPSEGTFINIRLGWSDWFEGNGDNCVSAPAITSFVKNRLDVFAKRGINDEVWHRSGNGLFWTDWESIGAGPVSSSPAAVSRGHNSLDIFARGMSNELAHKWWDGNSWSNWANLGESISSAPAVIARGANRIDVFARGMSNELRHKWWDGNDWFGWRDLGGEIASAPAVVVRGNNSIDIFARGLHDELAHKSGDGFNWSNWASLGGRISSAPCAIAQGANRIDVFARGLHNELAHKSGDGVGWSDWANLGGVLAHGPAAVSWGPDRIDVVAVSDGRNLLHKYW